MICLINDPTECTLMENTKPPILYDTIKACKVRAFEMAYVVEIYAPDWKAISWECKEITKGTSV